MRDKKVTDFVMTIARPDNYKEVVVNTCRRFPDNSPNYLIEVIRTVYHLNKWLQIKDYSRPARKLRQNTITEYQKVMDELYAEATKNEC